MIGSIRDISVDYKNRKTVVTMEVDASPAVIEGWKDKVLNIDIKKYSERRSLDSNAYFHVLCDKLRQIHGISMAAEKNELITMYGQILYLDEGQPFIYKTNAPPEYINEQETIHLKLIKVGDDGAYWYRGYRGSHTYNTEEMAKLINGTVAECKDWGIETATPDEILRMQELWARKCGNDRMD